MTNDELRSVFLFVICQSSFRKEGDMNFFDYKTDNTVYYIAAIIFLILIYIMYILDKKERRKMQLDIEKMIEGGIAPKRKGDEKLRAEFERRKNIQI